MSSLVTTPTTGFAALAATAGRWVTRVVAAYLERRRNRLAVNQLLGWSDYMLDDIGLTRADIRCALRQRREIEPSARLRLMAVERRATRRAEVRRALRLAAVDGRPQGRFDAAQAACEA